MPLTVNVGLSRKASENYQSTGVSINVSAELDQSLLARPTELQQAIEQLYQQAETALDRQAGAPAQPAAATRPAANGGNGHTSGGNGRNGNGGGNGNGRANGQAAAAITASQSRAVNAIAQRLGIDAAAECRDVFGWDLARLSIRQASALIDHLKGLSPAPAAAGDAGGH